MSKSVKVAINGAGRIGRNIIRAWLENQTDFANITIVAINDLAPTETIAHLLHYDSIHGHCTQPIQHDKTSLTVGPHTIQVSQCRDPQQCPWQEHNVDIVLECTGLFTEKSKALKHISAGAQHVLLSAPGKEVDATIVYGVNHHLLSKQHQVVSNASCTTNCLAPLVQPLHEQFGLEHGLMTTIHAITNDQNVTDAPHPDLRRARASSQSMIPTKTGAAAAIGLVLPDLLGKLDGFAMRVPTLNVSVVDLTWYSKKTITPEAINECLRQAAKKPGLAKVIALNEAPLVSIDFNHNPASSIFDLTQTRVLGRCAKVLAWYDNEWAFANRMLDTTLAWANAN
jgi:glyceraldehyde 3-phosphate dehydrogenase